MRIESTQLCLSREIHLQTLRPWLFGLRWWRSGLCGDRLIWLSVLLSRQYRPSFFQSRNRALGRRLRGPPTESRECRIKNINPRQSRCIVAERGHAAGAMRMQVQGNLHPGFYRCHEILSRLWTYQPCHILYADRIAAELLQLHGH